MDLFKQVHHTVNIQDERRLFFLQEKITNIQLTNSTRGTRVLVFFRTDLGRVRDQVPLLTWTQQITCKSLRADLIAGLTAEASSVEAKKEGCYVLGSV